MPKREKMSSVDTAWLRMDRPTNLMMIVGVLIFEGMVDYERLKATIAGRLAPFRRFRQRVIVDGSTAWWEDDPTFDIAAHVHRVALPGEGGKNALEAFVADMAGQALDASKPLWQFTLVENYGGGSALLVRIHHCIADGIALVGVMLRLTDSNAAGDPAGVPDQAGAAQGHAAAANGDQADGDEEDFWKQLLAPVTAAAVKTIDYSGMAWSKYLEVISQPDKAVHYAKLAGAVTAELAHLLTMPDDSQTRYKGKPGILKAVAWSEPMPLDLVKAVGRVAGGSVNDVLLSCVAGALRAYLRQCGDDPDGVEIRAMIPVNLRPPGRQDRLGNCFGLVALTLPLGIANPLLRLSAVRIRMEALKGSYQAPVTLGLLGLVGMAPKALQTQVLDLLARKATAVMTNVPGPGQPLYMAGAKLGQMMVWVPQSGDIGMGVSILSYNGGVQFGLVTDRTFVPDPLNIVGRFLPNLDKLLLAVLQSPRGVPIDPFIAERRIFSAAAARGRSAGRRKSASAHRRAQAARQQRDLKLHN